MESLEQRKNELKEQGRDLLAQGRYREALAALEEAQVYAQQPDPELDELIRQTRAALQPTAVPAPPTPTSAVTPTAVPLATPNPTTPDSALGEDYFGRVYLAAVPTAPDAALPPPQDILFTQDQPGLFVESISQGLVLPFTLRVFNRDTGILVGEASYSLTPPPAAQPGTPPPPPAPVFFMDRFVWYKSGGELPGSYRAELYADTVLTNVVDFRVTDVRPPGRTPEPGVPIGPTPPPAVTPAPGITPPSAVTPRPGVTPGPAVTPAVKVPTPITSGSPDRPPALPTPKGAPERPGQSVPPPGTAAPVATAVPTATPSPTPSTIGTVFTGGIPAGIAYNAGIDRLYVADSSGVVWSVLNNEPVLQPPFKITVERPGSLEQGSTDRPSSITVDPTSGLVYIGLKRSQAVGVFHGTTGERVRTLELPARPTKVLVNPIQRLVYAIMPERNSIAILDPNQPTPLIATANAPQATDMVVSEDGRTIYVIHFSGELSTIDARTGELRARVLISQPGLQGLTQGGGLLIATNVALRQLTVWDTTTAQIIQHVGLEQQPSAIAYGPITGTVYVLGFGDPLDANGAPEPPLLINVSPATGVVNGFVLLTDRAGQMQQSPTGMPGDDPDLMALNNNIAVNPFTEVVYLVNPEAGQVSIAAPCLFPNLAASPAAEELPAPDFLCQR